jgi:hypothetical protein
MNWTPASREFADHARYLHASDFRDQGRNQQQSRRDADRSGKDLKFSTLAGTAANGPAATRGSNKGAEKSQHLSAPSRVTTDLVTVP